MKQIEIKINKVAIFNEVSLNSSYIGAKNGSHEEGFYDRVSTISQDSVLLESFLTEMCGNVSEKFREFIIKSRRSDDGMEFTLELSNAYDDSLTESVEDDVRTAIVKGVAARWLRFTLPEESQSWLNESQTLLERALAKLCHRRKPMKRGEGS